MAGVIKPPSGGSAPKSSGGSRSSGGSSSSSRSSSSRSSGGSSSSDPYARARADQTARDNKAATRLAAQAARLRAQANALKIALSATGFKAELTRQLGNANIEFTEKDSLILGQYDRGKSALEQQKTTTEDNRARSLQEAGQNSGRERNEALQQGIDNGISATDMLKAQAASLRNWSLNTNQVQTNYTDEVNGIQSEHSQMVNSVVSSRQAAWREREQQFSQLYRGYYDNRGQALTEVGNKLGESAQYYDMANEQKASSSYKSAAKKANDEALRTLRAAAAETGKGYKERAAPTAILGWKGTAKIENTTDPRQWGDQTLELKDAEGAKLRKWEG
jgi:hypothetical protein